MDSQVTLTLAMGDSRDYSRVAIEDAADIAAIETQRVLVVAALEALRTGYVTGAKIIATQVSMSYDATSIPDDVEGVYNRKTKLLFHYTPATGKPFTRTVIIPYSPGFTNFDYADWFDDHKSAFKIGTTVPDELLSANTINMKLKR